MVDPLFSSFHPRTAHTRRPNFLNLGEIMAAACSYAANPSQQALAAYVEMWARTVRAMTPQEAAGFKDMAERMNVSDDEMEDFKHVFFGEVGEPPRPLAEVFGSDDAAKIFARLMLTEKAEKEEAERERGQARK